MRKQPSASRVGIPRTPLARSSGRNSSVSAACRLTPPWMWSGRRLRRYCPPSGGPGRSSRACTARCPEPQIPPPSTRSRPRSSGTAGSFPGRATPSAGRKRSAVGGIRTGRSTDARTSLSAGAGRHPSPHLGPPLATHSLRRQPGFRGRLDTRSAGDSKSRSMQGRETRATRHPEPSDLACWNHRRATANGIDRTQRPVYDGEEAALSAAVRVGLACRGTRISIPSSTTFRGKPTDPLSTGSGAPRPREWRPPAACLTVLANPLPACHNSHQASGLLHCVLFTWPGNARGSFRRAVSVTLSCSWPLRAFARG